MKKRNPEPVKIRLEKTTAEQEMLRSIDALASSLKEATDPDAKVALIDQINDLKEQMLILRGPSYSELLEENESVKKKLEEAERRLGSVNEKCEPCIPDYLKNEIIFDKKTELRTKLYRLLLKKYSKAINDSEKKTVGDLKALISDEDLTVHSIVQQFMDEGYSFPVNYLEKAKMLFEFLRSNIEYISLDGDLKINFWLTPKEMLNEKIADDEDFAVLLCSLLYSLGDHRAEVVIAELDNLETHAFVMTTIDDRMLILDPCQKKEFDFYLGTKEKILGKYEFEGARIKRFLYRFNRFSYEQFIE